MNSNDSQPNKLCSATLMRLSCNRLLCVRERSRVPYMFAIFVNTPSIELSILINDKIVGQWEGVGGGRPSVSSNTALAVSKKLSVGIKNSPLSIADI